MFAAGPLPKVSRETTNFQPERHEESEHQERGHGETATPDLQFLQRRLAGGLGAPGGPNAGRRPLRKGCGGKRVHEDP